jgi:thiosulfate/3-mercaptopyruvate sulfurtransferase
MRRSLALPFFPALGLLMMVLVPIQARGPQAPAATSAPAAPAAPAGQLLVNASWLAQHLQDPDLVVLHLGDQAGYDAGHIPGARLVAMNDVLVDTDTHLLEMPAPDELRRRLAALGVSDRSRIVVYWARDWVSPATRIVFTLDYAGMGARTSLLDGGMPAWVKDGHPLSTDRPAPRSGTLSPLTIQPLVVNAAFVRDHLSKPGYAVVDGRARALYDGSQRGGTRGRPHRTGHIAGARSIPYSELTDEALAVRSADRLRAVFSAAGVQPGDTVIGYCHLGQQATAMLFAARLLGHRVLLYDGSFEDWSRHPDYAVENPGAGGPTGRALTIEDYYRLQAVGAPAISPDGRWVSFTVSTRIEDDNTTQTATWIGPADATARPQRVSHFGRDITGARWDESNRLIYTVGTDRWTLDPAAPARLPVPASAAPEGEPSPDGTWIARLVDAPAAAPPAGSPAPGAFEQRHNIRFKGAIFDWKDFQRDGQAFPAPNLRARPAQRLVVVPGGGGDSRVLVDRDLRPGDLAWHPDGSRLVFTADATWRDELAYVRPDLWSVTLDGTLTRLTDDGHVHRNASFSPDGAWLAYVRDPGTDLIIREKRSHGGPSDLYVRQSGGAPVNLTAAWDLEPGVPAWSPDSRMLYFTAAIGGESHVFRVSVPGGTVEQVTKGERRVGAVSFDRARSKMAYTVTYAALPAEVWVANIDGSGERRVSDVHTSLASQIEFAGTKRLRWPSADGTPIEGWLTFPSGYDRARGPYPLIIFSHGGPHAATGDGFDFKKLFFAARGYFVLDTNFRGSTGYGEAFKWATWGAWGTKDSEDVIAGLDYVLREYPIDPKRVGHTGHSYGGFLTNWLITQYPDRFAAAISGAGVSNWVSDYGTADIYRTKETEFFGPPWDTAARERMIRQSPLTWAARVKTPTLFVHGEVDQRVPYEEGEQMYFALRRRGVPAKMIQYAGQPHGIGGHWNNVHRMIHELQWWDRWLGAGR